MESIEVKKKIKLASKGDVGAFAELFEGFRPMIYSIAYRYVGEHEANDVVMNTYLKAWKAIPGFKFKSDLKTWLFRICYNCAHDHLRVNARINRHTVVPVDEEGAVILDNIEIASPELPSDQAEKRDTVDLVKKAMLELPVEHREVLSLRFSEEMSYEAIAEITGVKVGTVMSRLFNAKKKLKEIIKDLESEVLV